MDGSREPAIEWAEILKHNAVQLSQTKLIPTVKINQIKQYCLYKKIR